MDLLGTIEQTWWLGLPVAVLVGVLLGASPLAWPVLAAAVGARAGTSADVRGRSGRTSVLALGSGITVVYASLGFVTGSLDEVLREGFGAWSGVGYIVLAVLCIGTGLLLLARPAILCHDLTARVRAERGPVGAFLLGLPLGVVNCPACAGVITGVALAAGATGSVAYAVAAMTALGLGHTLALWLASSLLLKPVRVAATRPATVQRAGAVLLVLAGLFYVWQAAGSGVEVAPTLP